MSDQMIFKHPWFWGALIIASYAAVIFIGAEARPLTVYMVTSTRDAAAESLLNCGNVAIESKRQAEAYAAARPGSHLFEIQIREVR